MIPAEVLVARAVHYMEAARMELVGGEYDKALASLDAALGYLERARG